MKVTYDREVDAIYLSLSHPHIFDESRLLRHVLCGSSSSRVPLLQEAGQVLLQPRNDQDGYFPDGNGEAI